jgi:hypothetical protein
VPRTERWTNDLKTKVGFRFANRFKILIYYNFFKQDYEKIEDYTQNYDQNEMGAGLEIRLMPKTWGFVRIYYGERDYYSHPVTVGGVATNSTEANDADYDWKSVRVGLTWAPGAKLSGEINFGYQWKDYDNRTDPAGNLYDDKNTWVASTAVNFTPRATTTISLSITRALRESGSNTNEYYEDTGIGVNLRQTLMPKLTLTAGLNYSKYEYNLPIVNPRDDDNYLVSIGLSYKIKDWLQASTGYNYNRKDSNYRANDYTDNQFTVSLTLIY